MTDDKTNTGNPDRQRISLSEDYEVRDWAQRFGVTEKALRVCSAGQNSERAAHTPLQAYSVEGRTTEQIVLLRPVFKRDGNPGHAWGDRRSGRRRYAPVRS